jgi:uncharacterized protein (DUF1697 family)
MTAMPVIISMLRGINVGGHNRIKMDALLAIYAALGLRDARAHIQSGNVIFRTSGKSTPKLAEQIESAIEKKHGFRPSVILRTLEELRAVIAEKHFAKERAATPNRLLVYFLARDPGAEARAKVMAMNVGFEELRIDGRELFIYFPDGMARPKLSWAAVDRALAVPATGRNWNTVLKMTEIAEELEHPQAEKK